MKRLRTIFLVLEALLYAAFLALDLTGGSAALSAGLKYAGIALVVLAGLTALRSRDGWIVFAALVLTAAADVFLLLLDAHYLAGVALFLCVQALYTERLCVMSGMNRTLHFTARAMLAGFAAAFVGKAFGRLEMLAAAYIVWFFMNLAHSVSIAAQTRTRRAVLFAAGLGLFFLCDLCVGVQNLPQSALSAFANVAMWAFYLPGQVLIVLSADSFGGQHETV